ncbi:MAG TPA: hypothetical protein VL485_28630 [Ktedonobacteraceae bacterium]|nr:hypothetical protein [Ktedonobacteraceae bacterium]
MQNQVGDADQQQSPSKPHYVGQIPQLTVSLGILLTGVLYFFLPENFTIGPSWILLVLEICIIVPFWMLHFAGHVLPHRVVRSIDLILLSVITLALVIGVVTLITRLPAITVGSVLLRIAALLWLSNVALFGLWYWNTDGGGPRGRHEAGNVAMDFLFPQQTPEALKANSKPWVPQFFDYLFLAFTVATAFSPTDTFPLTHKAKGLMMIEAIISLMIIGILVSRVANIL